MHLLFTLNRKYLLELGKAFIISLFSYDRILKDKAVAKVNIGLTKKSCYCVTVRGRERERERQREREREREREIKVGDIKLNYMA